MKPFVFLFLIFLLCSCGKELECFVKGDNVSGRIVFVSGISIIQSANFRVEWSEDNFTTIAGGKSFYNNHGLPTFGYSVCVDTNKNYAFRAYQDSNLNNTFDSAESSGRYDGTEDGNATYLIKNIPYNSSDGNWLKVGDVHIAVDVP